MDAEQYDILQCHSETGRVPFREWLLSLDLPTRARIRVRVDRLAGGNFGDHKSVGSGVIELRIAFGPGYRIYCGVRGREIHLIAGGSKATQAADIKAAKQFWIHHD